MNTRMSARWRSVTRRALLSVGVALLPATLTGQVAVPGHIPIPGQVQVPGQVGTNGMSATAPAPASAPSTIGSILLGAMRRIVGLHDKPATRAAARYASSYVAVHARGDTVSLQVYLPSARHVAVAGDMTDWHSIDMIRQRGGWWGIVFSFSGSVARLHMQSDDGDWQLVPGLPITRDEYGGTISLLVVPDTTSPGLRQP